MQFQTGDYADFVAAVRAISAIDAVFYYDNSPTTFTAYVIAGGRKISCLVSGLTSKPGSFDTDFPDAIELNSGFTASA